MTNDTVNLYCPWCESLPLTATVFSHNGTRLQLQLSRVLGGVEQSDRGDKAGRLYPTTGATHGTVQRTVHRRRLGHPNAKGDKVRRPMAFGPQRASMRAASTAPQNRSTVCQAYALKCENVLHKVISGSTPINSVQMPSRSVNLFLPRRPRGAYFVVLSSAACKVGRRIRQGGFFVITSREIGNM